MIKFGQLNYVSYYRVITILFYYQWKIRVNSVTRSLTQLYRPYPLISHYTTEIYAEHNTDTVLPHSDAYIFDVPITARGA
jgi:hypothetical protein